MLLYVYAGGEILEGLVRKEMLKSIYTRMEIQEMVVAVDNQAMINAHLLMVFALPLMNVLKEEEVMFRGNIQMILIM